MSQQTPPPEKVSIIYFGSGPLAAKSLEFLNRTFHVELVITKPNPPHHKGMAPVIEYCEQQELPYKTVSTKSELTRLFETEPIQSPLGVVIDFGIIISQYVIDSVLLGIVNSHFSLLPEWRGADPITFSVLSGQPKTGISLMLINDKMDEGPLLAQADYDMHPDITSSELTKDLIELSNQTLAAIIPLYAAGEITPAPQELATIASSPEPSYSRKLTKADGVLDFSKPAKALEREIRAFVEWPKSRTTLGDVDVIITQAHTEPSTGPEEPGHIDSLAGAGTIMINTTDGKLCIERLKPAGKNEMTAAEFLRGYSDRISN